jgi:hypothetical protein
MSVTARALALRASKATLDCAHAAACSFRRVDQVDAATAPADVQAMPLIP